jgi:hypothetical protein
VTGPGDEAVVMGRKCQPTSAYAAEAECWLPLSKCAARCACNCRVGPLPRALAEDERVDEDRVQLTSTFGRGRPSASHNA